MFSIGIDIQYLSEFPKLNNKNDEQFFKDNFTLDELEYAKSMKNTRLTLMGIFSVKESIIKCENSVKKPFNKIQINHDKKGKPFYHDFQISISHSIDICVTVALKNNIQGVNH
tara:strand:+ start:2998 stop:3336 length:339 start_codon:yes stop_codon:yes gene_type:complete